MRDYGVLVRSAEVATFPSPHLVIDDFFSPTDLSELLANVPPDRAFEWREEGLGVLACWRDSEVKSTGPAASIAAVLSRVFNNELARTLAGMFRDEIRELFVNAYNLDVNPEEVLDAISDWNTSGSLDIRLPGNNLPVHRDWPNRLVSVVVYLPCPAASRSWGTRLFEVERDAVEDPLRLMSRRIEEPFQIAMEDPHRMLEFQPNRMISLLNTPWSYHGALVESRNPKARRLAVVKGLNLTMEATARWFVLPPELT